ncbi:hypothetical protein [Rhizobium sp. J15]|uniref:hypothetical protein n=1 Tax=Rhizobium sp. J15 TaxID=2035450 RepID=UPI0015968C39|nr:hypothetical protein [Rhizobium sp. J15]
MKRSAARAEGGRIGIAGVRGRTGVPDIADWYMQGKIEIKPVTHTWPSKTSTRSSNFGLKRPSRGLLLTARFDQNSKALGG